MCKTQFVKVAYIILEFLPFLCVLKTTLHGMNYIWMWNSWSLFERAHTAKKTHFVIVFKNALCNSEWSYGLLKHWNRLLHANMIPQNSCHDTWWHVNQSWRMKNAPTLRGWSTWIVLHFFLHIRTSLYSVMMVNPLRTTWFCYNTHIPLTSAAMYAWD